MRKNRREFFEKLESVAPEPLPDIPINPFC